MGGKTSRSRAFQEIMFIMYSGSQKQVSTCIGRYGMIACLREPQANELKKRCSSLAFLGLYSQLLHETNLLIPISC